MEPDVPVGLIGDRRFGERVENTNNDQPDGDVGFHRCVSRTSYFRVIFPIDLTRLRAQLAAMAESGELLAYPQRLHHETPGWVKTGSLFHVRLRVAPEQVLPLTEPKLATRLLDAARNYHYRGLWHCALCLLMTDHIHALLSVPAETSLRKTVGAWKRYATRDLGVSWQVNFFDHRIRNEAERAETFAYIARNPVAKKLCTHEDEWPWVWIP